jgi:hypothetical protein
MRNLFIIFLFLLSCSSMMGASFWTDKYNIRWNSPSQDARGSMPIGNGDIGLNVWVEPSGDLLFYIGKSDAFDENSILQKLSRIRVSLNPRPIIDTLCFRQELCLSTGEIFVTYNKNLKINIWVDANRPIINIESVGRNKFSQSVTLETWRNSVTLFKDTQVSDIFKNLTAPDLYPTYTYPDSIQSDQRKIVWFHSNCKPEKDGYIENLRIQGLESASKLYEHPLFQRVYGGSIWGENFKLINDKKLISDIPKKHYLVQIACLTMHPASSKLWNDSIESIKKEYTLQKVTQRKLAHNHWWHEFWNRSWIDLSTNTQTEKIDVYNLSRAYNLSRFMNACASRGALPIKFNGSIFSYGKPDNPDYRRWGGAGFWFQNQRHTYYPMLAQGDEDLMQPFFNMYHNMLPFLEQRTKSLLGHEGVFFPETIFFWGAEVSGHYGWTPVQLRKNPLAECTYITYYWQNGIELTSMMLDYWEYTKDIKFLKNILLPHAQGIMLFYDKHYQLDNGGKILFAPASSLETYHIAINPMPEIAGLKYVIPRLLNLPTDALSFTFRKRCNELLKQLPDIPVQEMNGKSQLAPADSWKMKMNIENPELYAVFPYRLFGDKKPDLNLAVNAYVNRTTKQDFCWHQDVIDAVLLGKKEDAKKMILQRAMQKNYSTNRFPAFWNEGYDWTPDVDHGGVMMNALNLMLLQSEGSDLRILPCFPQNWNVRFKLHAPNNIIVECVYNNGKLCKKIIKK